MNVAIIPARGGSKRIPNKNIKLFCGKPIIAYSIDAAMQANSIDRVVVSTDSPEIAAVAKELGADAPFIRPDHLSNDTAATVPVIAHAIQELSAESEKTALENVCCLYATAPFVTGELLDSAYEKLLSANANFAFSACTFDFPVQRALVQSGVQGGVRPMFPEYIAERSQDLAEALHDAGQFYWGTSDAFVKQMPIFSEQSVAIRLPRSRVQDIDTPEDWEHAEALYKVAIDSRA